MKHSLLLKTLLPTSFAIFSCLSQAHAEGHGPGNGGSVYVCNGGKKVQLIDLIEPSLRVGLKNYIHISESSELVERQIEAAFATLDSYAPNLGLGARALVEWKTFRQNIEWRNGVYEWKLTDDLGVVPIPDGCEIMNAIMYLSDREISGQNRYRDRMTPTHQAALEVHEVVYKMMRDAGTVKDAVPARRLTALLFSDQKNDPGIKTSLVHAYLRKLDARTQLLELQKPAPGETLRIVSSYGKGPSEFVHKLGVFSSNPDNIDFAMHVTSVPENLSYGSGIQVSYNSGGTRDGDVFSQLYSESVYEKKNNGKIKSTKLVSIGKPVLVIPKETPMIYAVIYKFTFILISPELKNFILGDMRE